MTHSIKSDLNYFFLIHFHQSIKCFHLLLKKNVNVQLLHMFLQMEQIMLILWHLLLGMKLNGRPLISNSLGITRLRKRNDHFAIIATFMGTQLIVATRFLVIHQVISQNLTLCFNSSKYICCFVELSFHSVY